MSESLLEKYPHLKTLTKLNNPLDATCKDSVSLPLSGGRISLLGPGVGTRTPLVPLPSPPAGTAPAPRSKVDAEQLFAASVAADDDQWLQFQVDESVPAKQQLDQLKMWLVANRPSTVTRSSGVGWIAVKFRDKGKKVLEAKEAWDNYEGERNMEVVNKLSEEFNVKGGKWLCHLPIAMVDQVWSKLATTFMSGGLGPTVYMVKVSPVQDIKPEQGGGEHVVVVYNADYKDTEQVMRVENLMRSAGVTMGLSYKPDIFSALGIYRNNKWGFRPTIYCSRVLLMEGKSRVETVGTDKWYYNTSKGLQYPPVEKKEASKVDGKENDWSRHKKSKDVSQTNQIKLPLQSLDAIKIDATSDVHPCKIDLTKVDLQMEDMEKMKLLNKASSDKPASEVNEDEVSTVAKLNTLKSNNGVDHREPKSSQQLSSIATVKHEVKGFELENNVKVNDAKKEITRAVISVPPSIKVSGDKVNDKEKDSSAKKAHLEGPKKPAWLLKLEQLKLKSLDEMSKTG